MVTLMNQPTMMGDNHEATIHQPRLFPLLPLLPMLMTHNNGQQLING